MLVLPAPDGAERTEGDKEQPASDHGGQHERQMNERIKDHAARKTIAREQPRDRKGDGKCGEHRDTADLQRQRDDPPFFG